MPPATLAEQGLIVLKPRRRAQVRDMRTVQELLRYLLRFNAVSFLRYLQCLRAAAGPTSEWLLLSAANTVFQVRGSLSGSSIAPVLPWTCGTMDCRFCVSWLRLLWFACGIMA